ncbi:DNA-binding transcriptional ArsR family regulator [Enterococcus sp. PF1-24]|uniref:ArsR/SmtB family transcription factor n=1 Tax=unclassified Enterococcus TaxID=2608891 RepID=UPI002474377A|nr:MULTISPECIES: metalloregulator ArsR/SmtB family transcription factor [unclassified Enterococcus]MDH6365628.1 DNA-binding transcriptional ArsR family regulator [Enterococcus sp. PFB1-1]MDH6402725.1 DNA-binding transcriptional ArsR family regulator [Enterococcus sp. PF1-24]
MEAAVIQKVSQIYKILSDPNRLKILLLLKDGEKNVGTLVEEVQMEQSAVSHQLKLLRENRIVKSRRDGKIVYYSLDDHHIIDILAETIEHVEHQ